MGLFRTVIALFLTLFFLGLLSTPSARAGDPPPLGTGAGGGGEATISPSPDEAESPVAEKDASSDTADTEGSPPGSSAPDETSGKKRPLEWKFYWLEGLHYWLEKESRILPEPHFLESLRPKPKLEGKIGIRLHVDAAAFAADAGFDGFSDDIELRRFRLYTNGQFFFWTSVFYSFKFDITKDSFYLHDGYLQLREVPWIQTFTFGNMKAPFSIGALISSRDTTFLERAAPVQAFAPGFKPGFKVAGSEFKHRLTWAFGYFANGQDADIGDVTSSNARIVVRTTGLVFFEKDYRINRLLHLGLNYSYVDASDENVEYQSRPESYIAPVVVDTGPIPARNANLIGTEIAFVSNSLSFQGESIHAFVDPEAGGGLVFSGYYVFVSFFPTGETRPYDTARGIFTRVRPRRNFSFKNHRLGGIEIHARASHLDLNDRDIKGGEMNIGTVGLTWYPVPIFKMRFEYGMADIDNVQDDGVVYIFQTRLEVDL